MHPRHSRTGPAGGFTLLELVVVMALLSLMTALAGPRLWTWVDSARDRADVDRVLVSLQSLPSSTYFSGRFREVAGSADLGLELPSGWVLHVQPPLRYEANGMTAGARVILQDGDRIVAAWQVRAPAGEVAPLEAP